MASTTILGISADYHDAAAALVTDGEIVAAAEEERFTRTKHDPSLPEHAVAWCLEAGGVKPGGLDGICYYDKPLTTYERILVTHAKAGPRGFRNLARALSEWSRSKLWVSARIEEMMRDLGYRMPDLAFAEHHQSHAASAFYPSPFDSAAVLTFDGVGEWATSSVAHGVSRNLEVLSEQSFPDSLGMLYSAITAFCGFAVNDGEYKLMGLAPYGEPRFLAALRDRVVNVADDGSVRLNQKWFDYQGGTRMTRAAIDSLLDGPPRPPEDPLTQREADIASSVQMLLEEVFLRSADYARRVTGETHLCLAGGVALNCVANGRLLREGPFDDIWIQPAAGDAGGAIGAALWDWHALRRAPRGSRGARDGMAGARLGPSYGHAEIVDWLGQSQIQYEEFRELPGLCAVVAAELDRGAIVGWFEGSMEFGPRALGARSILADPRDVSMVTRLNAAVKGRESFRPFAPAVLDERASEWFEINGSSPYMTFTVPVRSAVRPGGTNCSDASFAARLSSVASKIPACTHVDGSARVQTVGAESSPAFRMLIEEFDRLTGCPVLLNTSFNRASEPIVRTPADAYRCFRRGDLDLLVLERCLIRRYSKSCQVED